MKYDVVVFEACTCKECCGELIAAPVRVEGLTLRDALAVARQHRPSVYEGREAGSVWEGSDSPGLPRWLSRAWEVFDGPHGEVKHREVQLFPNGWFRSAPSVRRLTRLLNQEV